MKTVKMHIFGINDRIPVYSEKEDGIIMGFLNAGEWLGIVDENEDYYLVLSPICAGWVKREDFIGGDSLQLQVEYERRSLIDVFH